MTYRRIKLCDHHAPMFTAEQVKAAERYSFSAHRRGPEPGPVVAVLGCEDCRQATLEATRIWAMAEAAKPITTFTAGTRTLPLWHLGKTLAEMESHERWRLNRWIQWATNPNP